MRSVCVFCGSSPGAEPAYREAARRTGELLAARGLTLVYGGGGVGLMGVLADAVLLAGGHAIGVIPEALAAREVAHTGLPDLRIVGSMHERKALMAALADGFVALPGGLGTFEELFEIVTWGQLGLHGKPCGLVNTKGYYDRLVAFLDHAVEARFVRPEHRALILVESEPTALLDRFAGFVAPKLEKWIDRDTT
ncbi:TIGR00730 family Rossman fold protein [Candidatus Binatia bacterium]|nr:TIGR00730 family Rossman fold protein [Candidatus Binatia bacterium]